MAKIILAINAGSSSLKISVFSAEKGQQPKQLAEIQISGLTAPPPKMKYTRGTETVAKGKEIEQKIDGQDDAFKYLLDHLINDDKLPEISAAESISHVGHRIVHGGDYSSPQPITQDTLHHLEALTNLAPLHNGPALSILRTCMSVLPSSTTNIAFFDTLFHSTLPAHIRTYAINQDVAREKGLRKYGFHGISYAFITRNVAEFLGKEQSEVNLIACHLGSGASICVVKGGKSINTSMGLTPLDGLPGATRSGSVDPSLIFHYAAHVSATDTSSSKSTDSSSPTTLHLTIAESILNKKAGWSSLTGTTDFARIVTSATSPESSSSLPNASLALNIFTSRILSFIGSYFVELEGQVDALVFAGGIGEASDELRSRVVEGVKCLGFEIDGERNKGKGEGVVWDISSSVSKHRVLVCTTDEQAEMARQCVVEKGLGLWE